MKFIRKVGCWLMGCMTLFFGILNLQAAQAEDEKEESFQGMRLVVPKIYEGWAQTSCQGKTVLPFPSTRPSSAQPSPEPLLPGGLKVDGAKKKGLSQSAGVGTSGAVVEAWVDMMDL